MPRVSMCSSKVEMLITLVQQRPVLWRLNHPQHKNSNSLAAAWKEVTDTLNVGSTTVKNKWKSLKTRMRTELSHQKTLKSGSAASNEASTWEHFESLMFLKDHCEPKASTGNLTNILDGPNEDAESDTNYNSAPDDDFSVELEECKPEKSVEDNECYLTYRSEHVEFFSTLIPHLSRISPKKILEFRNKVTALASLYAYGDCSSDSENDCIIVDTVETPRKRIKVKVEKNPSRWQQVKQETSNPCPMPYNYLAPNCGYVNYNAGPTIELPRQRIIPVQNEFVPYESVSVQSGRMQGTHIPPQVPYSMGNASAPGGTMQVDNSPSLVPYNTANSEAPARNGQHSNTSEE